MKDHVDGNKFYSEIIRLLQSAREKIVRSVNHTMVLTYFEIGRLIVEEQQNGKERAEYGTELLSNLSKTLINEFGKGYSASNLKQMRQFYLIYSKSQALISESDDLAKRQTLSDEFNLSWSHYLTLMRIEDESERSFYEIESNKNSWSVRELQRQIDSALYTRLTISRDKNDKRIKWIKLSNNSYLRLFFNSEELNKQ